jgi:hypothetical protein
MIIKLNDKIINYNPELPITWQELLSNMLRNFIDKKHGITRIVVDNKESIEIMTETPQKLISKDIELIEIFTSDSATIANTGFNKINQIIQRLKAESVSTANLYREGKINEASQNIIKIINAISPVIFFVNSIEKNFNFDFNELDFNNNVSIKDKLDYFSKSIEELVNAQEKNDFIEIADYLEYQFSDDLNDWEIVIDTLLKEVDLSTDKVN